MGNIVKATLARLGAQGFDVVSGFSGVVGSVCFDAYGCVQVLLTGPAKDGKLGESYWFDVKRVRFDESGRVLPAPGFMELAEGKEAGGNALPMPPSTPVP